MDYLISMLLQGMLLLVFLTVFITAEAEEMHGRHVCSHQQTVAVPVPIQQSYIRAVYKKDIQRTVYQTAYKTVFKMQIRSENVTGCCPGWEKRSPREANCMKPVCEEDCENEGQCVGPDLCVCGEGYTGYKCHIDIDECSGRNTCQQKCTNMPGSYECSCQDGFILAEDEYTCDLCISCTEEFQNLSSQVEFMKNFPRQNDISLEVNDNMNNMTLLVKQEEAIQNIYNQLANLNDTIVSTERFQNLQTQFDNIKETISKVDSIPELKARIDVLQESSLHTDKFLEIQNRIDDIAEVKEIVETVQTLNDTVHRLLEDGTKTEQLQELQKLVGDLVLSKAQQDEAQTSKFDEMNKELQQLREINVLQETVHEFKDEFQEVSGRVDQLIIDKVRLLL
uniref:EGF-like domain-containing protein n=1 Tax=Arion vulgaris TaxID=1028688 RepID=A0A0B7ACI5_9EUPU